MQAAPRWATIIVTTAVPLVATASIASLSVAFAYIGVLTSPRRGHGGIYGMRIEGSVGVGQSEWDAMQARRAETPDVRGDIPDSDWVTDDIQERFWRDAKGRVEKMKNKLKRSSAWRQKMSIDSILEVCPLRCCCA
jgi:hypothetical protein